MHINGVQSWEHLSVCWQQTGKRLDVGPKQTNSSLSTVQVRSNKRLRGQKTQNDQSNMSSHCIVYKQCEKHYDMYITIMYDSLI